MNTSNDFQGQSKTHSAPASNDYTLDKEAFGAFVAARRKELQLTQKQLARQVFVSDKAVSKWERGVSHRNRNYEQSTQTFAQ